MGEIENKILSLLELGYNIDQLMKELNIDKEKIADLIIDLDSEELICAKDKNWILTKKGKDILAQIKESLKNLKFEYVDGNISRDDFLKKKKELEDIILLEKPKQDNIKEKNINCSKCGKGNKGGSKYCSKCGTSLDN